MRIKPTPKAPRTIFTASLFLAAILCFFWPNQAWTQDYDNYKVQESVGPIPVELRTLSSEKYAAQLEELGTDARGKSGKARDQFLLQSNFEIDELLSSGMILFNDPFTQYVANVKDIILAKNPGLAAKIKVYVLRSAAVNAFATNDGTLVVNLGLLAHLKSEAELAFVLCHEIQHYLKKHPIESYVKREEVLQNSKLLGLRTANDLDAFLKKYSKAVELEADSAGLALYLESGYSTDAIASVFDLLDYAEFHFEEKPWEPSFFESDYLRFHPFLRKENIDPIALNDTLDDALSTHPSILIRRERIQKLIPNNAPKSNLFQIDESTFLEVRKKARFELSNLFIEAHAYEAAIYNSYLLLEEESESFYLKKNIAYALYGLATFRKNRYSDLVEIPSDSCQGEFQSLAFFFENLPELELNIIALREAWKLYIAHPNDRQLKAISETLVQNIWKDYFQIATALKLEKPNSIPTDLYTEVSDKDTLRPARTLSQAPTNNQSYFISEMDKNEEKSDEKIEAGRKDSTNLLWSICELMEAPLFAEAWLSSAKTVQMEKDSLKASNQIPKLTFGRRKLSTGRDHKESGLGLNIHKMVIAQTIYKKIDVRKKIPEQYLASEAYHEKYLSYITEMAQRNNIETTILENNKLAADDIKQFNDAAAIQKYLGTKLSEERIGIQLIYHDQARIDSIVGRLGTPYFGWNGLISLTDHREKRLWPIYLYYGIIYFPMLPFVISEMARKNHTTVFVTIIFDLSTGESLVEDFRYLEGMDRKLITRAILYDIFMTINQEIK